MSDREGGIFVGRIMLERLEKAKDDKARQKKGDAYNTLYDTAAMMAQSDTLELIKQNVGGLCSVFVHDFIQWHLFVRRGGIATVGWLCRRANLALSVSRQCLVTNQKKTRFVV